MKILSVDDSKMVHMIIGRALKPYGVEHIMAMNGQEGLDMAQKDKPDLIILDVTMPVMTGMETLEKLKSHPETAEIPTVMLTAEGGADSMERAFQLGISKYLTKPFTEEVLIGCLGTLVPMPDRIA